ncbi:MAG: Uma2 family endonuclease [Proteobacteria bacterium]|nr:Uma2 family endonuclease [Pseudomonadota bacterium]
MSTALRLPMDRDAFLAWENRQELRYEFDGFAPVAMTGGTFAHAMIQSSLLRVLGNLLRGSPCRVVGSELKVLAAGSIRYPDAFVICSPVARDAVLIEDPVVIFEILSPATATTDRIVKNREYRATPSVQRYVLLEQIRPAATVFTREGTDWIGRIVDADAVLALPELGIDLPLAELYEGIAFPDPPEDD